MQRLPLAESVIGRCRKPLHDLPLFVIQLAPTFQAAFAATRTSISGHIDLNSLCCRSFANFFHPSRKFAGQLRRALEIQTPRDIRKCRMLAQRQRC